jgi:hypothetical protein
MEHTNYDSSDGRSADVTGEVHVLNLRALRLSQRIFVKWQCCALLRRVVKRVCSDVLEKSAAAMLTVNEFGSGEC